MQDVIGNSIKQEDHNQRMQHVARIGELPTGGQFTHYSTRPLLRISGNAARDRRIQRQQQREIWNSDQPRITRFSTRSMKYGAQLRP
jgi:hypothetical protein